MTNKGCLYIVSGPSGTGKGTVCKVLAEDENVFLSISSTTREVRTGEVEGVTYNYISKNSFEEMISSDTMLEWAVYSGNYYGTPRKDVEKMLNEGKNVILEIEVQGAFKVKEIFPETVMIFVVPPSMKELKKRLTERGRESESQIKVRMETARRELELAPRYDYVIINDTLENCVEEMRDVIRQTEEKRTLIKDLLNEKY
mgnify:CR=1 FL=1